MSVNTMSLSASSELPSLKEMVVNLAGTAKDVLQLAISKGVIMTTEDVVKKRWDLCCSCEHFIKEINGRNSVCQLCGCAMKTKILLAASQCPVNKWN